MKKSIIVIAALLATSTVAADTKAYTKNKAKGKIVLSNETCDFSGSMNRAYFYTKDHYTEEGCWVDDDLTIFVQWEQEGDKRYEKKIFTVVDRW